MYIYIYTYIYIYYYKTNLILPIYGYTGCMIQTESKHNTVLITIVLLYQLFTLELIMIVLNIKS